MSQAKLLINILLAFQRKANGLKTHIRYKPLKVNRNCFQIQVQFEFLTRSGRYVVYKPRQTGDTNWRPVRLSMNHSRLNSHRTWESPRHIMYSAHSLPH